MLDRKSGRQGPGTRASSNASAQQVFTGENHHPGGEASRRHYSPMTVYQRYQHLARLSYLSFSLAVIPYKV